MKSFSKKLSVFLFTVMLSLLWTEQANAHCDGLDGPVIQAAQKALKTEDINLVLIWVPEKSEKEIMEAFKKTLAVRKLGNPDAKDLADLYFFETVVRLHREAEGAPYTGLKPAGRNLGPAIPAADQAIRDYTPAAIKTLLLTAVEKGLDEHFWAVLSKKDFQNDNVKAGREYVKSYVSYIHYVEALYEATNRSVNGHYHEAH